MEQHKGSDKVNYERTCRRSISCKKSFKINHLCFILFKPHTYKEWKTVISHDDKQDNILYTHAGIIVDNTILTLKGTKKGFKYVLESTVDEDADFLTKAIGVDRKYEKFQGLHIRRYDNILSVLEDGTNSYDIYTLSDIYTNYNTKALVAKYLSITLSKMSSIAYKDDLHFYDIESSNMRFNMYNIVKLLMFLGAIDSNRDIYSISLCDIINLGVIVPYDGCI